jgi:NAD(P)H-dependent FMN reductase
MRHSQYVDGIRSATTQDALDEYSSKAHKERQAMLYEMSYLSSNGEITQEQAQEWYRALKASALNEETAYKEAARRVMASESGRSIQ